MAILDSITGAVKRVGDALVGAFSAIGSLVAELFARFVGIPGFFLDIVGLRSKKKLRLKFIILRDANGRHLVPAANIEETLKLIQRVYLEQAKIEVIHVGTLTAGGTAPSGALDVTTPFLSFLSLATDVGTYFNSLAGIGPFTRRLSVIIVNTLNGDDGRSHGPVTNFVLIEKQYFEDPKMPSLLAAHEIGHACGLYIHRKQKVNLMHKSGVTGEKLSWVQSNIVRGSRFCWYF